MKPLYLIVFSIWGLFGFFRLRSFLFRPGTILNQIAFTPETLKPFNGQDHPEVYLSYNRKVYNVSSVGHYTKGSGSYAIFSGHEMAWALVKSDMEGKLLGQLPPADMTAEEKGTFEHWEQFYQNKYPKIGYLVDELPEKSEKKTEEQSSGDL